MIHWKNMFYNSQIITCTSLYIFYYYYYFFAEFTWLFLLWFCHMCAQEFAARNERGKGIIIYMFTLHIATPQFLMLLKNYFILNMFLFLIVFFVFFLLYPTMSHNSLRV